MRSKKHAIAQLKRRADELARQETRLADENGVLKAKADILHDLLLQRNALLHVLERVESGQAEATCVQQQPHQWQEEQQLEENEQVQQLLQQLPTDQPMHEALTGIDQELYESVTRLTPAAAVDYWVEKVKDIALLMHMYERDPAGTLPSLAAVSAECMRWCLAVHIFNPRIMYALQDYNMVTRRYEKFDTTGLKASLASGTLTPGQLERIKTLLSIVQPRLEKLEQEKQHLLSEIERLDEQFSAVCVQEKDGACVHPAESDDCCSKDTATASSNSCGTTSSSSGSGHYGSSSAGTSRLLQRRAELLQQLDRNYTAWRVTSQMRGQWLTCDLTAPQAARGILAAFPYMPHGAPVFDATRSTPLAVKHPVGGADGADGAAVPSACAPAVVAASLAHNSESTGCTGDVAD